MRIAIDAMGGDYAPAVVIDGSVQFLRENKNSCEVILVGNTSAITNELKKHKASNLNISILDAPEVIEMHESPAEAMRKKPDSSIGIAIRIQREGKADATVSAGNTGALMALSIRNLGRLEGVNRPALVSIFPSEKGGTVILDVGANADCKDFQLLQFAIMGSIYSSYILGKENPTVGLLNIGEEKSKGCSVVQSAYELLEKSTLNFVGNVEGRDILTGKVNVVVCDGFVGNVLLKFTESIYKIISKKVKESVSKNLLAILGIILLKPSLSSLKKDFDYAEYGGAPLIGINGVVIKAHGSSSAKAIKNALKVAQRFKENKVNEHIKEKLEESSSKTS